MNRYREKANGRERFFGKFAAARYAGNAGKTSETEAAPSGPPKTATSISSHTHEFMATTSVGGRGDSLHSHRFAGVTSEAIPIEGGGHKHTIFSLTGSGGHIHEVGAETGPAVPVGGGRHVHFIRDSTTEANRHVHRIEFATLIDDG